MSLPTQETAPLSLSPPIFSLRVPPTCPKKHGKPCFLRRTLVTNPSLRWDKPSGDGRTLPSCLRLVKRTPRRVARAGRALAQLGHQIPVGRTGPLKTRETPCFPESNTLSCRACFSAFLPDFTRCRVSVTPVRFSTWTPKKREPPANPRTSGACDRPTPPSEKQLPPSEKQLPPRFAPRDRPGSQAGRCRQPGLHTASRPLRSTEAHRERATLAVVVSIPPNSRTTASCRSRRTR